MMGGLAAGLPAAGGRSIAERLGRPAESRMLIIHADDAGMCHSANQATIRALTSGIASSASVMVPCPWFPEMAAWARENPAADLGLHLTLTSEWRQYRWRPILPAREAPGLVDGEGFFHRDVAAVVKNASADEVEREIRAQIDRARQFGMKPTHIDSHMGALFARSDFLDAYLRASRECRIMAMLPRPTADIAEEITHLGIDYPRLIDRLEREGHVCLDRLSTGLRQNDYAARRDEFYSFLDALKPGVTELIVHLALDDAEIRAVTGSWQARWSDYRILMEPASRRRMEQAGVEQVTYAMLSRLWGAGAPGGSGTE